MRVVCISDTHGLHAALQEASPIPPGDVFIHAGDFTDTGARDEVLAFNAWLATLPHKHKIVIAGNHESTFDRAFYPENWYNYGHEQKFDPVEVRALLTNALYLEDQAVLIDGFLFYGSPWQPEFCNWAFNLPRGEKLVEKWKLIPSDVDVLITHSPPMGRGDQVGHLRVGCSDLLHEVQTRIKPPYHVFGHVHEGYGRSSDGVTSFMNASSCTHEYEAVNPAMTFDLKKPRAVHDLEKNQAIRYDVMLHEQLRVCSQKPVFVPLPRSTAMSSQAKHGHPHGPCHSHAEANARRASLKEFSVDGTTAAMLFESTLKLRPVKAKQTRALRYLFHHGFKGAEGEACAMGDSELGEDAGSTEGNAVGVVADAAGASASGTEERHRERRRVSLSRRVTMAVLNELPDATRDAIAPTTAELLTAAAADASQATASGQAATPNPAGAAQRRARRDKTLHRREAVAKLATMVEEPEKEAAAAAEAQAAMATSTTTPSIANPSGSGASTTSVGATQVEESPQDPPAPIVVALEPAPTSVIAPSEARPSTQACAQNPTPAPAAPAPAKECIMCKYKVPGHVHPASDGAAQPSPPSPPPPPSTTTPTPAKSNAEPPSTSLSPAPPLTNVVADVPAAAPVAECILCKYKVAGHVHPGAEPAPAETIEDDADADADAKDETADAAEAARTRTVGPKRLSSWF